MEINEYARNIGTIDKSLLFQALHALQLFLHSFFLEEEDSSYFLIRMFWIWFVAHFILVFILDESSLCMQTLQNKLPSLFNFYCIPSAS